MKRVYMLAAAMVACVACAGTARAADGLLNSSLADAKKADFFTFFHLEETGTGQDSHKHKVVTFKPASDKFRKLVTVKVTLDKDSKITGMELTLARSFIDDKASSVFARDIAKSLLLSALAGKDRDAVKELASEIMNRDLTGRILIRDKAPELPAKASAGFLAFQGKQKKHEQTLPAGKMTMENRKVDDAESLVITVGSK